MVRVLWVTAESPDRNLTGGSIRQAYLLEALGQKAEVHLVMIGKLRDQETRAAIASVVEIEAPAPQPEPSSAVAAWGRELRRALAMKLPAEIAIDEPVRAAIRPFLADADKYDVVCVEHEALAPLLPPSRRAHWVLTLHNLGSRRTAQQAGYSTSWPRRWRLNRQVYKWRRLERWAGDKYDLLIVMSEDDARVLGGHVTVIPTGVDVGRYEPMPVPREPTVVMTAALHWPPNIDAAQWFCQEVFPRVRQEIPNATFNLVGRYPSAEVRRLAERPGVRLDADVPSVAPFLAAARVVVAPVRAASGIRQKALDAMAAGRAVVGTSNALEGMGMIDGVHALIADDPTTMAQAVIRLLTEPGTAELMGHAARQLAEERYAWARISQKFNQTILDLS
jgi:glycosyltransferase involved in cell wall biosynthesis